MRCIPSNYLTELWISQLNLWRNNPSNLQQNILTMKKIIASLLLIAGCMTVTVGQNNKNAGNKQRGEKRVDKMMSEMTTTLSLTTDQQAKIKPILEENGKTMKENREKYKGNHKCIAQSRYQSRKATEEKIMAVLTPEQQTKFQEEKKKRMEDRKKKREAELAKPIGCGK
jgi:periplasmic protein CpxP/Spy